MRTFIITLGIICVIALQVNAQNGERDEIAADALETFKVLVTEEDFEQLGFGSTDEVENATLGLPIQVFMVQLDDLQEYQGGDPEALLSGGDQFTYPVLVHDEVLSSIILMKRNEEWEAVAFGWSNLTRLLTEIRNSTSETTGLTLDSFFAVRVPALNLYFLAHRTEQDVLMLTPLFDDPALGFKAKETTKADAAFEVLIPVARAHDGLPG